MEDVSRYPEASLKRRRGRNKVSPGDRRERKRTTNRLCAQRKRERERLQLDTLTDCSAQLSFLNKDLLADNNRLKELLSDIKLIRNFQNMKSDSSIELSRMEELNLRTQIAGGLCAAVAKALGPVYHANGAMLDPNTGSAAATTTTSPFKHTTEYFSEVLVILRESRDIVELLLQAEKQTLAPLRQPDYLDTQVLCQGNSLSPADSPSRNDCSFRLARSPVGGPSEYDRVVASHSKNRIGSRILDTLMNVINHSDGYGTEG